jgi:parvulin-like peptidyl-prolyl isomerase
MPNVWLFLRNWTAVIPSKNYILLSIAALLICNFPSYTQPVENQGSYVARAGSIYISEQEFLKRYELLPGQYRNRRGNVEESKLAFLYSLVAEKLLVQEAVERHIDQDTTFQNSIIGITKMLARDQLYQEEISGKITVTNAEIQKAITDARRQLALSFLWFEDSTDAAFVGKLLKNCRQFGRFQIDSTMTVIRDTATLVWGEAEAPVEQAGFRLKKGECSAVVKASTGYYIIHLEKESPNPFYTGLQPQVLYERVEAKLRLRKEKARLDEYLWEVLHTKTGFALPRPFKIIAQTLNSLWKDVPLATEQMVTDSILEVMRERCRSILQDSIVAIGSSYWNVQDVLMKLRGKVFMINPGRTTGIAAQLNNHLQIIVQQELLAEEALSRKLDERWSVKNELDIWRQQILAKYEEMNIQRNVQLSDQEIFRFISETSPDVRFPRVQIRELHTGDLTAMEHALAEMRSGIPFEEIIRKYSTDTRTAQNGGLSGEFTINERPPLGTIAWTMNVGEHYGPVKMNNDYFFFELVKKEFPAGMTDSSFNATVRKAGSALYPIKQKKVLDAVIAKSARDRGYDIYTDRLKMLTVSGAPMMTYRILGFGGRMFAVPFVTPQVDWVGIEDPEKVLLP